MKKKIAGYTILLILSIGLCGCKSQSKTKDVPVSEALLGGWEMAENEAETLRLAVCPHTPSFFV